MPRRHRRIRRRDATGNYVTNEGVWFRLGRGVKERHTIPMKNKEVNPAINRRNARQSLKNNRHRYPRSYAERTPTMALPHSSMNTRNPPDPAKTSTELQKRLSPAALRSPSTPPPQATSAHSSAATEGIKINKTVIIERPDHADSRSCRCERPASRGSAPSESESEYFYQRKNRHNFRIRSR